jgi:aminoglycoside phosphotransferase (APT) family kinase protein
MSPGQRDAWKPPLKHGTHDTTRLQRALTSWLESRLGVTGLELSSFDRPRASGVSNDTFLFAASWHRGRRDLVARLQTDDPLYLDGDVERQFLTYRALANLDGVVVPEVIDYEPDPGVLGTPFFVMEQVAGQVPSDNPHFTTGGWLYDATPAQRESVWRSAVEQLVALHRVEASSVAFLQQPHRGATGLEQDLAYWRESYRWAADAKAFPILDAGEAWLIDNLPSSAVIGLSWGDARIENMVFNNFTCAAVLDFETASLAGASSDLAWWALMDRGSENLPGLGSPQQTLDLYRELSGTDLPHLKYFLVLCAFRLSAIYIRLAAQLAARGLLTPETADLAHDNQKVQQLALLLGMDPPGPGTARLPQLDLD